MVDETNQNSVDGILLNNLDLSTLVGAPLQSIVDAQAQAALASVDFMFAVGFEHDETTGKRGKPVVMDIKYNKEEENEDGTKTVNERQASVPLLTMLHTPFIRIDRAVIEFNAKINNVVKREYSSQSTTDSQINNTNNRYYEKVKLNMSYSSRQKTSVSSNFEESYSMNIRVETAQDEIPPGIEQVLDLLQGTIKEEPAGTEKLVAETDVSLASGVRIMDTKL